MLAATRAALDPDRRGWQRDILVSTIIEVLVQSSVPLRVEDIAQSVNALWDTKVATSSLVRRALHLAAEAHLAVPTDSDWLTWKPTESAAYEVAADRRWVESLLKSTQAEFADRLNDSYHNGIPEDRVPRLFLLFLGALLKASAGIHELARDPLRPLDLRPVHLDVSGMGDYIKGNVAPRSVAKAMVEVAGAAISPHERFGSEVLQLILLSNVLHGLLSRRDAGQRPRLDGTRIVLDTTVLLYMIDSSKSLRNLFNELLVTSQGLGVEVVVAEHTLHEWNRLWRGAEQEMKGREDAMHLAGAAYELVENPFLRAYFSLKEEDPQLTWGRFLVGRKDIRGSLEAAGVVVRPDGNHRPEDRALVEAVIGRLTDVSADPMHKGKRSAPAAAADAQSCAMVARWRESSSATPAGWFISSDKWTGRVYRELRPNDPTPLTVTPESWLLFLAAMKADDPEQAADLARAVTDATRRNAFLSIATSYTLDEALELSGYLAGRDQLSAEELTSIVQYDLSRLLDEAGTDEGNSLATDAATLVRRRSARRDARAKRDRDRAVAEKFEAEMERARLEGQLRASREAGEEALAAERAARIAAERRERRATRAAMGIAIVLLLSIVLVLLVSYGAIRGKWTYGGVIGIALVLVAVARSILREDESIALTLISASSTVLWFILSTVVSGNG